MTRLIWLIVFVFVFVFVIGSGSVDSASAQSSKPAKASQLNANPLTVSVRLQPSHVSPGQTAELHFDLHLDSGFHAYENKFKVSFESPAGFKVDDLKLTPIVEFDDVVTKSKRRGVSEQSHGIAIVEVPEGFSTGDVLGKLNFTYQACADDYCLFQKRLLSNFLSRSLARSLLL